MVGSISQGRAVCNTSNNGLVSSASSHSRVRGSDAECVQIELDAALQVKEIQQSHGQSLGLFRLVCVSANKMQFNCVINI